MRDLAAMAETTETITSLLERAESSSESSDRLALATAALVLVQSIGIDLAETCRSMVEERLRGLELEAGKSGSAEDSGGLSN